MSLLATWSQAPGYCTGKKKKNAKHGYAYKFSIIRTSLTGDYIQTVSVSNPYEYVTRTTIKAKPQLRRYSTQDSNGIALNSGRATRIDE
jgi:hypothetical protein